MVVEEALKVVQEVPMVEHMVVGVGVAKVVVEEEAIQAEG